MTRPSMEPYGKPLNPMLAMIQRQQQEQQQYEALSAGKTLGASVAASSPVAVEPASPAANAAAVATPAMPHAASPTATMPSMPSMIQQQQMMSQNMMHQTYPQQQPPHIPQQIEPQQQATYTMPMRSMMPNEAMYGMYRPPQVYPSMPMNSMMPMGPYSPSHSPAPNHMQPYSQMDMTSMYYQDPSTMTDPQMAYMMSSQAMMNPAMYSIPNMSASPVPHMYMNSMSMGAMNNTMGSAMNMYGNMGLSMPMDNASGGDTGTPSTPTKLETSNLTSKPVQSIDQPPQPPLASASSSPVAHMAGASSPVNTLSPSSVPAAAATPPLHRPTSSDTNATILASNAAAAAAAANNMAEAPPKPSVYIPKTRLVETYGGIDIKVFEKYDAKPPVMLFEELGTVDMHALIMSLKSGLPMEMTNALNTLTTLSKVAKPLHLFLRDCDDLLDTLLDALEAAVDKARLSWASSPSNNAKDETSYPQLFETALDEMKSLIPRLEDTSSDTWLPRRELCWCILNILRNLSYLPENQQTMADDQRCIDVLTHLVDLTHHYDPAVSLENEHDFTKNGENGETIANGTEKATSIEFRSVDILDCRKSVLLIFANVAQAMGKTPLLHASALQSLVSLTHDFIVHGHNTYYCAVAIDTWNKLVVRDFHRQLLAHVLEARFSIELAPNGAKKVLTLADDTQVTLAAFPDADAAQMVASQLGNMLVAMVKMLRRQFYLLESGRVMALDQPQLTTLETLMMGLYTVVAAADSRLCSQWIENDKQMPASIARIALTLALMNQNHLRIAAHRALDVVYVLVLGGAQRLAALQSANATLDPRRHTASSSSSSSSASTSSLSRRNHFTITAHHLDDSDTEYVRDVASRARALLYASNIQDKLVMAMLNPAADPVILNLMDDLLSSLNSFTHLQTE